MAHYYESVNGGVEARHFCPLVSRPDDLRPTTIRDVRGWWKEGRTVVPSVTTILDVLGKPGLVNWKIDRHLEVAFEAAINFSERDAWIAEIRRLTELEMDKAPTAGSDLHKSLEGVVLGTLPADHPDRPLCIKALGHVYEKTGNADWYPERRFISPLGYGGQVDLSNDAWVIDFKTKQDASKWKPGKMVYPDMSMQLAAYREGLNQGRKPAGHEGAYFMTDGSRCANVFICPENGEIEFVEHTEEQLQKGWRMFTHCLGIWDEQNRPEGGR